MKATNKKSTVVVAMSGGVDSSVAAALLVEQGHNVIGVTMKMFNYDEVGGNIHREASCCGLDAFNDARMVAVKLDIPHYILDYSEIFGKEVISDFISEYGEGRTPNPCVVCNRKIKWSGLLEKADQLGAEHVATGHYARMIRDVIAGDFQISRSKDREKDQTYALWGLKKESLSRTLFPLGDLTKPDVRQIAKHHGLKTATKEESFEICFVADNDYRRFLKEQFSKNGTRVEPGDILFDGKIVGKHDGIPFFTIGQRSGIGAYGEKVYVTGIDPENNAISIGRNTGLMHDALTAKNANFFIDFEPGEEIRVEAMVRYKDTPAPARLTALQEKRIKLVFDEPKRAITPGQSAVFYQDQRLIGGGIIEGAVKN